MRTFAYVAQTVVGDKSSNAPVVPRQICDVCSSPLNQNGYKAGGIKGMKMKKKKSQLEWVFSQTLPRGSQAVEQAPYSWHFCIVARLILRALKGGAM